MNATSTAIAAWLIARGLDGASETELLHGFCGRCREVGLDLSRAITIIDTLHPVYEGRAFRWRNDGVEESAVVEYGRTNDGRGRRELAAQRLLSPADDRRRRAAPAARPGRPARLRPSRGPSKADGQTDYVAFVHRFASDGIDRRDGLRLFALDDAPSRAASATPTLAALRRLVPALALAIKCASLGAHRRHAGRGLSRPRRRPARARRPHLARRRRPHQRRPVVLRPARLHHASPTPRRRTRSSRCSTTMPTLVISAIHEAGGDVLKLIGDGTLAIFQADDPADACRRALARRGRAAAAPAPS